MSTDRKRRTQVANVSHVLDAMTSDPATTEQQVTAADLARAQDRFVRTGLAFDDTRLYRAANRQAARAALPGRVAGDTSVGHPSRAIPTWVTECPGPTFLDSRGTWWCVSERACRAEDPLSVRSLVFMSETAARRVLDFPADWSSCTPDQFETLSWHR
jgi:predicted nucleic acid-binding Zn ribbon protein